MTKSNSKSIKVVQFTHPGEEHSISQRQIKAGNMIKAWNNTKDHKRKFLHTTGACVEKGKKTEENDIYFWGEWEPESEVSLIDNPGGDHYPHFIHEPFLRLNESGQLIQGDKNSTPTNTDPFVFGEDGFYYSYCKQNKNGKPTQMQDLEPGSIILFGSTINQNTDDAYFALDTVFVVGPVENKLEYNKNTELNKLKEFGPKYYCDIMNFKASGNNSNCSDNGNARGGNCGSCGDSKNKRCTCYRGASFDDPIKCGDDKMYSFVPCKIGEDGKKGFERVKLRMDDFKCILDNLKPSDFFQNNLNSASKITPTSFENNFKIWKNLREIIKENGCYEAVKLNYTER